MKKYHHLLILFLSLLMAVVLPLISRGTFAHGIIVIGIIIFISMPTLVMSIVLLVIALLKQNVKLKKIAQVTAMIFAVSSIQLISMPIGNYIARTDIAVAKKFCESLIPIIEQYYDKNGKYPENVEKIVTSNMIIPNILNQYSYYSKDGLGYYFYIPDPADMIDGYIYESKNKKWVHT